MITMRDEITEKKSRDIETRRLQKTRKTTAKMKDCLKIDIRKAEEKEKCREKANKTNGKNTESSRSAE